VKLRTYENLDELEKMALVNMSYSRLDTYEMCPSKYFFTYILKEDRMFGAAASLGNVIHGVLEDTVGEPLKYEHMIERMEHHRGVYDPDGLIDETLLSAGKEMIGEFVDRHAEEKFDIIGKEKEFSVVIGSALVRGFIDLLMRDADGTVRVVDYKSGKWEVSAKAAPTNLQLGIYALAASIMFPDTPIYAELYYLRSGRRKGHLFTPENMEEVYETVLDKVNTIINDRHFKPTQETRPCTFCDYAKPENPICSVGVGRMKNRRW